MAFDSNRQRQEGLATVIEYLDALRRQALSLAWRPLRSARPHRSQTQPPRQRARTSQSLQYRDYIRQKKRKIDRQKKESSCFLLYDLLQAASFRRTLQAFLSVQKARLNAQKKTGQLRSTLTKIVLRRQFAELHLITLMSRSIQRLCSIADANRLATGFKQLELWFKGSKMAMALLPACWSLVRSSYQQILQCRERAQQAQANRLSLKAGLTLLKKILQCKLRGFWNQIEKREEQGSRVVDSQLATKLEQLQMSLKRQRIKAMTLVFSRLLKELLSEAFQRLSDRSKKLQAAYRISRLLHLDHKARLDDFLASLSGYQLKQFSLLQFRRSVNQTILLQGSVIDDSKQQAIQRLAKVAVKFKLRNALAIVQQQRKRARPIMPKKGSESVRSQGSARNKENVDSWWKGLQLDLGGPLPYNYQQLLGQRGQYLRRRV